ncbi:Flp pilus assembly complex ATPase component TadA [Mobilitalea sibirica]|uniref:Flp pilus assembly complex ATPase component TadA n=1 Tax=Mobilitalea sibirica TaxID=1462919 RepID=A0A8J7H0Q4_9FIRM|nr:ATPase, T2SS/T4P/T4SS family [Mobilitalea sibirica]MBH1939779.1 Flp pilus assembly complex ATPase component TadA [Mobilitalea sibirica]
MEFNNKKKRLGDILIDAGVIDEQQLATALAQQKEKGQKLGETLIDLGYTTEVEIANALHRQLNCDFVVLSERRIEQDIIKLVGEEILRKHSVIPFEFKKGSPNVLRIAMSNPLDYIAIDDIAIVTNFQIEPAVATSHDIASAIDKYYGNIEALKVAQRYTQERDNLIKTEQTTQEQTSDEIDNAPIVVLVRSIIEQGIRQRASDVHIEPLEDDIRVRYRIDGVLSKGRRYSLTLMPAIIARVKIISGMDISEKRRPQDGRISLTVGRLEYDIRSSILPTVYGEKVVLRIASKNGFTRDKRELGFTEAELVRYDKMISQPHGIILITGPTGSGKSTTLYTILTSLNKEGVNLITIEDPVEAHIPGVNQVQVNDKVNLTFASALRSILRQDPDIIMIGEIRDQQTAEIAVKASITGHLVASTIHTNSAASTVTRMTDMGVEPYLLSEALAGIIAQRLVRKLCPDCRKKREATEVEKHILGYPDTKSLQVHEAVGCVKCNDTGYIGRIGVYEILQTSTRIREAIRKKWPTDAIAEIAESEGMKPLRKRAIELVYEGITTVEELLRISFDEEYL